MTERRVRAFYDFFFSAFAFVKALESVELPTQSYIFSCSAASQGFLHVSSPAVKKRCVFFHLLQKFFCSYICELKSSSFKMYELPHPLKRKKASREKKVFFTPSWTEKVYTKMD